jgi:hypothetical protein
LDLNHDYAAYNIFDWFFLIANRQCLNYVSIIFSANVSNLKRQHGDSSRGDGPAKKLKIDSNVIVIDPPSPPTTPNGIQPTTSDMTSDKPDVNTSTEDVDTSIPQLDTSTPQLDTSTPQLDTSTPQLDTSIPQLDTQSTPDMNISISDDNIPNIDTNIVEKVRLMSPQQQFQALLSRTQQLYDLRGNVCKLLRVLVPELEVDDRKENFEDQTVDELLKQVLEQADNSDIQA